MPFISSRIFLLVAAEEQGVDEGARCFQPSAGALVGTWRQAVRNRRSRGRGAAVLVAALVGLALDVEDDPAGLRIAVGWAVALHSGWTGAPRARCVGGLGTAANKLTQHNARTGLTCMVCFSHQ